MRSKRRLRSMPVSLFSWLVNRLSNDMRRPWRFMATLVGRCSRSNRKNSETPGLAATQRLTEALAMRIPRSTAMRTTWGTHWRIRSA